LRVGFFGRKAVEMEQPWHGQDAFWENVAPVIFSQRRRSDAPAEVEKIISLLGVAPGSPVLDLGCGVGRHALELARRGFRVTGVDRTQIFLDEAGQRAEKEELNLEWVRDDMRAFCRTDAFDVALSFFTSFGYFEDPGEDRLVVGNVQRSLRTGGAFLLEMMGKEVLAKNFQERIWYEADGFFVLEERKVSKGWSWLENRWIVVKREGRAEFRLTHRLYSAAELIALLADCGFTRTEVYGDLEGNPYDHTAKRLIVVARK
jgi:SAM-dependent methyltransferase